MANSNKTNGPSPAAAPAAPGASLTRPASFWRGGDPYIWVSGAALAVVLLFTAVMLVVVTGNGITVFWPARLAEITLKDGGRVGGEIVQWRTGGTAAKPERSVQVKTGNRDLYGLDFRWIKEADVAGIAWPDDLMAVERREFGDFYGRPAGGADGAALARFRADWEKVRDELDGLKPLESGMLRINNRMENVRLELQRLRYRQTPEDSPAVRTRVARLAELKGEFDRQAALQTQRLAEIRRQTAVFRDTAGREKTIALADIVRFRQPNRMGVVAKAGCYLAKVRELLFDEPREANTEGGLFPAILGTVMMVFLMSLFSFPLGVVTGVYLREYAKDGWVVRAVRIAVNNLAGIPSIVYGIFGLGFFIYGVGGALDKLFFPERLPTPTFGTGGILWASLTLALLTVPVVIVATEEALGAIPTGVRHASLALGATRLQTLLRVLIPMASPGIMTGFILAMARAAGEVAPLMITGVVKLAPAMPVDLTFPFIHLDRKFMHLGFHIYDIGFQSPNVEAAKPMVFVTTLLLLLIVLALSSTAILLRNRMKKKYTLGSF